MSNATAIVTLDKFLAARHDLMRQTMPSAMKVTPERIQKIVVAAVANDDKLASCTPQSIWSSVNKSIQLGLEPCSPLGHSYLVPFKNKGTMEATLIVGYKGLIALARRSGEIESVSVRVVREGDKFRVSFGHDEIIEHVPNLDMKGKPTHYYCIIRYKGGGTSFEVLTREMTDATRARSRASESGPWVSDYDAMAMKTAVKRAMRTAPLSVDLADAIEADDMNEIDVTPHRRQQKVPSDAALPPAAMTFSQADDEMAAANLTPEAEPVVVVAPVAATAHDHSEEIAMLDEDIQSMDDADTVAHVREKLETARVRKTNPLPKADYDTLARKWLDAKKNVKGGAK